MSAPRQNSFSRWYENQGERLNEQRRRRYQNDPEYRQKALEQARRYRREGPRQSRQAHYKHVHGVYQRVYRITELAAEAGVNPTTLRRWEANGFLPKPHVTARIRFYTQGQLQLIAQYVEATRARRLSNTEHDQWRSHIHQQWEAV